MEHFDFLVLGGGSGGLAAARRAASHGARVLLVEAGALGGTCVNVGCIPKKVMWNVAAVAEVLADARAFGFDVEPAGVDWRAVKRARDAYVERLRGLYARNLEADGVGRVQGWARLLDAHTVGVGEARYRAEQVLIATGGRPRVPELPGADLGITSDGFFELEERPARVAVVGAGYIAAELAGVLHAVGTEVTLFIRHEALLRSFDAMLGATLMEQMESSGVRIERQASVEAVERDAHGKLRLWLRDGRSAEGFETLLWAVGRQPTTAGLGLDTVGVAMDTTGHILVDALQRTNVVGVSAVGDVTGRAELTPVAIAAGRRLADRLFGGEPEAQLDYSLIPTVIFSHPPIGSVGMSEEAARAHHGAESVRVYASSFVNLYQALSASKPRSRVKLVTVGPEERVVGVHVIGRGADELLQGFAVAVRMGATKRDFDRTIAIHPTAAEELVTLR